jgi:hypothetical protein
VGQWYSIACARVAERLKLLAGPPEPGPKPVGGRWLGLGPVQSLGPATAIAIAVFWLADNRGTFSLTSRSAVAIVVWWTIVLTAALGLARLRRPSWQAITLGGFLLAFGLFSLISAAWAPNSARALEEFNRVSLYFGVFLLVVAIGSAVPAARWSDGLALGIASVGIFSLVTRLVPELANTGAPLRFLPAGQSRLAYPLGYWNALAVLLAVGVPLLARAALESRTRIARGLAAATLPAFGGALYLTSSRAGSLATAVGVIVFVIASNRRLAAAALIAVAGFGAVLTIAVISGKAALVDGPLDSAAAASQGHAALLPVALVCIAVGTVWGFASARVNSFRRPSLERAAAIGFLVLTVVAVVAVHPVRRFDEFKQTQAVSTDSSSYATSHLLSASGNGRWQMWTVSMNEFRAHPLAGAGAGAFQSRWMKERPYPLYVVNAHSLFVEVLGDLGIIGFVLIVGFFGAALVIGGMRVLHVPSERRTLAAAFVAALCAYIVGAAVDWMWQVTALTVVAIVIAALLAGGQSTRAALGRRELPTGVGAAIALVGIAAILAQALPMISAVDLGASQAEAAKGNLVAAAQQAASARSANPWSPDPYVQLSLIQERAGAFAAAQKSVAAAIERDPENWQVWAIRARIETEAGAVAAARLSLHQAARLNPLWAKSIGVTG